MELSFIKTENGYVSEFKVESDFNLHVETEDNGAIELHQTSVEGANYDKVERLNSNYHDRVVDKTIIVPLPPMWLKITSTTRPTLAIVTSNGEITEGGVETILNTPV